MKITIGALLVLVLGAAPAWAVLGEYESSVSLDQQALRATHREEVQQGYKLHSLTTGDGTVVKEYISPMGIVFGISWQGHFIPNLHQLLGSYMTNLQQGQRTNVVRRRSVTILGDNFVFFSIGHLRFFHGKAYVPGLIPANLTAEVVQ
jgi:hypothetical protein